MIRQAIQEAIQLQYLPPVHAAGLQAAFRTLMAINLGLLIGAMTVPSKSWPARAFRVALFCWLLPKVIDFSTNRSHTFGHIIYDGGFALFGWHYLARAIDIAFVSPGAPRWIQPTAQELQRMRELRKESFKVLEDDELPVQVPKEWDILPYPAPFTLGRLLYAFDLLTLTRPGTSWLFPWQFRAFDWSLPALQSPISSRFGRSEGTPTVAVLHGIFWQISIIYCYVVLTQLPTEIRSIKQLSLPNQLVLTFAVGCIIALSSAPLEATAYKFLLRRKIVPVSAIVPSFNQPYLSTSIEDFWGRRWHRQVRRQLTRVGSLFPYGRTKSGNAFWAYVVSGVFHSFLLARAHPEPSIWRPLSYLPIFLDPGTVLFFGLQGVGMLIERLVVPEAFKRLWLWFTLIGSGRWYVDAMLKKGYATR